MSDPEDEEAYQKQEEDGRYQICDQEENVILTCGDAASAEHYLELLNRAYRRGFKAGLAKNRKR